MLLKLKYQRGAIVEDYVYNQANGRVYQTHVNPHGDGGGVYWGEKLFKTTTLASEESCWSCLGQMEDELTVSEGL